MVLYRLRGSLRTYLYPASILRAATTICHRPVLGFTCHACHATLLVRWLKRGRRKWRMSARKITTITGIGIDRAGDTFCEKKWLLERAEFRVYSIGHRRAGNEFFRFSYWSRESRMSDFSGKFNDVEYPVLGKLSKMEG